MDTRHTGSRAFTTEEGISAEEKDRLTSRLAGIDGVRTLPSVGTWIMLEVTEPTNLARKVNRRLGPGSMKVNRDVAGMVRIFVSDPSHNEQLFRAIREFVA
ncbi:MAG TPA: hypothetical protein QF764_02660 [Planctomycetota bacterium]|jgi:histidinol-phosphate/aromatic aminotransferase/cobyric acid decarboxylase-like protein|nr:hypothetical protein [Planctomycetota bacterium]HJP00655.1 hypothetical protein [Planctomycetota bacterium]